MAAFPDEVYDRPMLLALLKMRELQLRQFAAPQSATEQYGKNGSIALSFERVGRGRLKKSTRFLGREPSRTPSFLTPFTRRTPAASSGLSRPASAAS